MTRVIDTYELSPMQAGMLFHTLSGRDPGVDIQQQIATLREPLDKARFLRAWQRVAERHPILRSRFRWKGVAEPVQDVVDRVQIPVERFDWRALAEAERHRRFQALLDHDRARGFDLGQAPLMRLTLVRAAELEHRVLVTNHHILLDGCSKVLLLQEVFDFYEASLRGGDADLPLPRPYRNYIQWLRGLDYDSAKAYWQGALSGFRASTPLVVARDREAEQVTGSVYGAHETRLSAALTSALRERAREASVTLNTLLQGAWALLLHRYSGEPDIVFGATRACRKSAVGGADDMLGLFINTLPIRVSIDPESELVPWLQQLHAQQVALREFEHTPLVKVQGWSEVPRGMPLFESILVFEHRTLDARLRAPGGAWTKRSFRYRGQTTYPLTVMAFGDDQLLLQFAYSRRRFEDDDVARMLGHLQTLLEAMAARPHSRLKDLRLLTDAEKQQLLVEWNDTRTDYPRGKCIHELFEEQAARTPDAVAVEYEGRHLRYGELNARANQLARYLARHGVGPDVPVALFLERSLEMLVGIVGILKAGGAYVPIDPAYPKERLGYILEESKSPVVLTQESLVDGLPSFAGHSIRLDADWAEIAREPEENPVTQVKPEHLAYVLFTSGSTGRPKGVALEHRSAATFVQWGMRVFTPRELAGVLFSTSVCFDLSVFEIFVTLSAGGKVIVARNALHLPTLPEKDAVTLINTVPSAIAELLRMGAVPASVKTVNLAGEALSDMLVEQIYANTNVDKVYNLYGPTETTTYSTYTLVRRGCPVTIGRPIADTQCYILDASRNPVPIGVMGELYIAGGGLARGYFARLELTNERFVPNPFSEESGERMYRTGDLCRWLPDGNIQYQGRRDHQVKLRGYRIELGEIEATLVGHQAVRQVMAMLREDEPGDKRLVAYVVAENAPADLVEQLRVHLRASLPDYMVPSAFVVLENLPLTPSGKVDRKALPAPEASQQVKAAYVAPRTPVEEELAQMLCALFGAKRVGVHDNFFELGGHSLTATQFLSRIRARYGVELPIDRFFDDPTISALAVAIGDLRHDPSSTLLDLKTRSRSPNEFAPLSFAQGRAWFIQSLDPSAFAYNYQGAVKFHGHLDIGVLERCLSEIVRRHEIYRTTFPEIGGEPVQQVHAPWEVRLRVIDLNEPHGMESGNQVEQLIREEGRKPFDLTRLPLVKWFLMRLSPTEHILAHLEHHLVHDGWSLNVLLGELVKLYEAYSAGRPSPLEELPIQFADFAVWQRKWMDGEVLQVDLSYWKRQLAGSPGLLELPCDRPRPLVPTYAGEMIRQVLPGRLAESLRDLSRSANVTLFMSMQAAFAALLGRYCGQVDICVGTGIANRRLAQTESLIGMILNNLVLRHDLSGDPTFRELQHRAFLVIRDAYKYQDVPFEKVVDEVRPARSSSYHPLFQVMFSFHDSPLPPLKLPGLTLIHQELVHNGSAKFDLNVIAIPRREQRVGVGSSSVSDHIDVLWEYNTDIFDRSTVERLVDHFERLLDGVVADPDSRLSELPLLTKAERHQLLVEWNATEADYPQDKCLHELFEEQAARTPDAVAVEYEGRQLSYGELNARANQLARYLAGHGVGPEVMVGLCVERSLEMVVGVLGILKAGGAYVPLDPDYPAARLAFMLEDTAAPVLLTQARLRERLPAYAGRTVSLDADWPQIAWESEDNPGVSVNARNLAYVIYTSGSTGRPKGTCIEQRSVVRLVKATNYVELGPQEVILQFAPLSFDASTFELWGSLMNGAKLVVCPAGLLSLRELGRVIQERGVTTLWLTAALFHQMVDEQIESLRGVRQLLAGGETLSVSHVRRMLEVIGGGRLINGYGPTENTTFTCCHVMTAQSRIEHSVPIGRPISNTRVYVLDRHMQPVPVGVHGELYIGGAGLAREYLHQPQLTAEKFVPDPFTPGARLYRTGDLVRYLPDGNIEFLGRIDHQVKIRGFRVELGEIESVLQRHPAVREVAVLAREDVPGDKRLVAYLVAENPPADLVGQLRSHLRASLPEHMVPAHFVTLEALPLTPNGKVDRKALPAPSVGDEAPHTGAVAPRTAIEEMVMGVFRGVLERADFGVLDSFFDLGGHSLMAARLMARLQTASGIDVSLRNLFESPTVAGMAEAIDALSWSAQSRALADDGTGNREEIEL
jgi:amino acid adenylation domain-containing protein